MKEKNVKIFAGSEKFLKRSAVLKICTRLLNWIHHFVGFKLKGLTWLYFPCNHGNVQKQGKLVILDEIPRQ